MVQVFQLATLNERERTKIIIFYFTLFSQKIILTSYYLICDNEIIKILSNYDCDINIPYYSSKCFTVRK